jgi:hypothetical protein
MNLINDLHTTFGLYSCSINTIKDTASPMFVVNINKKQPDKPGEAKTIFRAEFYMHMDGNGVPRVVQHQQNPLSEHMLEIEALVGKEIIKMAVGIN